MDRQIQPAARPLWRTALALGVLFLIDLGFLGQGVFALIVAFLGVTLHAARSAWSALRGPRPLAQTRALRGGLYLLLGVATFVALRVHEFTGATRAEQLIQACRAYQTKYGQLPGSLQQLVPEFLSAVPRAKYASIYADFTYWVSDAGGHRLMYVVVPPFGRRIHDFERDAWGSID